HSVRIAFTNDYYRPGRADRNLYLGTLTIQPASCAPPAPDAGAAPPPPPPPPPATDYSGLFLGASMHGLLLGAITPSGTTNAWQNLQGPDAKYGDKLPRAPAALFGGTAGYTDSIQIIGAAGATVNAIQTDNTVPAGVSDQVLAMTMIQPYDNAAM